MNATTRKILGVLLEWQAASEAGDSAAAERLLQQAIDLDDGTDSDARTKSGLLPRLRPYLLHADALRRNDPRAALRVIQRAATRWPEDVHVHLLLGRIHLSEGDGAAALTALQRSFEIEPRAVTCMFIASAFDCLERSPEGAPWLHRALELDPNHEEAHYNLGFLRRRAGDLDGAIACFRRAIELDPNYALAHAELARDLTSRVPRPASADHPDWVEAIEHYRRAVELDPNDGWSHAHLATLAESDNNLADTKTHHRAAMRLLPRASPIWSDYADFASRHRLESSDEVDRLFRYAIELDPDEGAIRYFFAHHLWRTNRDHRARTEIQEAHRLGHPKALAWLAEQEMTLNAT
jgi:tetratricopeptide (TPR) repeat protein